MDQKQSKKYGVITEKMRVCDYSIEPDSLVVVGETELDEKRLVHHHITSANDLYNVGINQMITQTFRIDKTVEIPKDPDTYVNAKVSFTGVHIEKPTTINYKSGQEEVLYPNMALTGVKTYSANLKIDATITLTSTNRKTGKKKIRTDGIEKFKICKLPIMVRSVLCNTHNCTRSSLEQLHEDPDNPGGYFIVQGVEYVVVCTESLLFNQFRIYKNTGYGKEVMRAEHLSKPGDGYQNSEYFLIRWLNDNRFTCEIKRDKLKNVYIPFYLLFRALGWTSDEEIFDNIMYGYKDISDKLRYYFRDAFDAKYTHFPNARNVRKQNDVYKLLVNKIKDDFFKYLDLDNKPENYKIAIKSLKYYLDVHFMPHIGCTPEDRHKKCQYLALFMRKVFLVRLGSIPQTDRDSYKGKRIHPAGMSYAKTFKTYFNASIIQQIVRNLLKSIRGTDFEDIDLKSAVKAGVYGADFERSIIQTITSGNKSKIMVNKKQRTNNLSSQLLNMKNGLSMFATLRLVTVPNGTNGSGQSDRAKIMRRVHMSFLGYICISHSPTGETVGINKQIAAFASILGSQSSEVLKSILAKDKDIIGIDNVTPELMSHGKLFLVFVNGSRVGVTADTVALVKKYRTLRRKGDIFYTTTIHWESTSNEVYFWVDANRMVRPLLIVYNKERDPEAFKKASKNTPYQGLALTQKHIDQLYAKDITMDYLLINGVIEYITPEEQENCYICADFRQLYKDRDNDLHEYTHCDIPQGLMGITTLTSPFGNHNQAPRVTFQGNQGSQTCGMFAKNYPYRRDKDTFLQYINEFPLVRTIINNYVPPNGSNVIVAIMCYTGYNQEDSLIVSKGAIDRGLFSGCKFTIQKTVLDKKETFGNPNIANTAEIKSASYEKLTNGIISLGTTVEDGDAIIGKYMKLQKPISDQYINIDKSIIYKSKEKAIVDNVMKGRNDEGEQIMTVSLRKPRPVIIGDKFSSRAGQKGVTGIMYRDSDMPMTETGVRPSIIVNPHAIPSRMTIGQLQESVTGNMCAGKGTHVDATVFKKVDMEKIGKELESMGMHKHGYHRLYSGITGQYIDTLIFMGPTYYQRLQKFIIDALYTVTHGPSDAKTGQPLDGGKSSGGGLRFGEMERDVLVSHGVSGFMLEKLYHHSDRYITYVCRCGRPPIVNHEESIYKCKYCKDDAEIMRVSTGYAAKLFRQLTESMNVKINRYLDPYLFEVYTPPQEQTPQLHPWRDILEKFKNKDPDDKKASKSSKK
jgi:DNA-directed RNA polymerase beta subunit